MGTEQPRPRAVLLARLDQPLIGIIVEKDGQEVVQYFVEEETQEEEEPQSSVEAALSVIGVWSDLDWEETVDALDRIRHESRPTPPIEL